MQRQQSARGCLLTRVRCAVFTAVIGMLPLATPVRGQCFGGTLTFERTLAHTLTPARASSGSRQLVRNSDSPILRDCIGFCRQSASCSAFVLDYSEGHCVAFDDGEDLVTTPAPSNARAVAVFQQRCLRGVAEQFGDMCGNQRLWTVDSVPHAYLADFDSRELTTVSSRVECFRACLLETSFVCRSADYSFSQRVCRLSSEDRHTQPSSFRVDSSSSFDYLENQCARDLPDCRYDTPVLSARAMVLTADLLEFAESSTACAAACTNERRLWCRAYTYDSGEKRCYLSSDYTMAAVAVRGASRDTVSSKRVCTLDTCDGGVLTYEKVAGHVLQGASEESLLMSTGGDNDLLTVTAACRAECDNSGTDCPAFVIDYLSRRCYRLDRNTQGRRQNLQQRQSFSYFEKICIESSVAQRACAGRLWSFERAPGRAMRSGHEYRVLNQVPNRRDCQEACVADGCRSATFDADRLQCRLSHTDRRLAPEDYVAAERSIVYLENHCVTPASEESNCRFTRLIDKFPRYVDLYVSDVNSRRQCQRVCQSNEGFICRSFSFYPTTAQCVISGEDSASVGSVAAAYLSRAGTDVYEHECVSRSETHTVSSSRPGGVIGSSLGNARDNNADSLFSRGRCDNFEMVVAVELRGVSMLRLLTVAADTNTLLADCSRACRDDLQCLVFSVDHSRQRCWQYDVAENWTFQPENLLSSAGVTLFHRICVSPLSGVCTTSTRQLVVSELHVQSALSVQPDRELSSVSRRRCRQACFSERSFVCLSATYVSSSRKCHLSRDNRHTLPRAYRQSVADSDYMENGCGSASLSQCRYVNRLDGQLMLYTVNSLSLRSEADCQRACNVESGFICASYTFLITSRLGDSSCLLSAVRLSDLTGHDSENDHTEPAPGAVYAERMCTELRDNVGDTLFSTEVTTSTPLTGVLTGIALTERPARRHTADTLRQANRDIRMCAVTPTYEKVVDVEFTGSRTFNLDVSHLAGQDQASGLLVPCLLRCERDVGCLAVSLDHDGRQDVCVGLTNSAGQLGAALSGRPGATYYEKVCIEERTCGKGWTFERVPNHILEGHDDQVIQRVAGREHCQLLCLRNVQLPCRSAEYDYRERTCTLSSHSRRTSATGDLVASDSADYMENQCAEEPENCQYRQVQGRYLPHVDRVVTRVDRQSTCRRRCDIERDFRCRSYNYIDRRRQCLLSGDDTLSRGDSALVSDVDSVYAERSVCRTVQVDCTKTDMIVTFTFGRAFNGRVYATGNAQACFDTGNGRKSLAMPIPLGRRCGTEEVARGRYVNHVVIQQHPTIMQQTDRTVRVECTFDAEDQTITLAPTGNRFTEGGGVQVSPGSQDFLPASSVVTNTAPTPSVGLRVVAAAGDGDSSRGAFADVDQVSLGEPLTLVVVADSASAFGVFAKSVEARTDNGELLPLIDERGCPLDVSIFPALRVQPGTGNLVSTFRAFRFPSTARVNFFATVQFCQDECPPVDCGTEGRSFGRRRRRSSSDVDVHNVSTNVSIDTTNSHQSNVTLPLPERLITDALGNNFNNLGVDTRLPHELPLSAFVFVNGNVDLIDDTEKSLSKDQQSDDKSRDIGGGTPMRDDSIVTPTNRSSPVMSDSGWDVITSWRQRGDSRVVCPRRSRAVCHVCVSKSAAVAAVVCLFLLQLLFLIFALAFYRLRRRDWLIKLHNLNSQYHQHIASMTRASSTADPTYCSSNNLLDACTDSSSTDNVDPLTLSTDLTRHNALDAKQPWHPRPSPRTTH